MSCQGFTQDFAKYEVLMSLKGQDIIGLPLKAPLTSYDIIYTLPMAMITIKKDKGTGILISVPSLVFHDNATLRDLKERKVFCEKYSVKDEMILPFNPVSIIQFASMKNELSTDHETVCDQMKIQSKIGESLLLHETNELTYMYLDEYNEGVMTVGICKGDKVQYARQKIVQLLIDNNEAALYHEPERTIISRSGDQCVVALCDQWYFDYGEEAWKESARECLKGLRVYSDEARNSFNSTLDELQEHAFSHSYGLGTKLPWDPQYVIECLSDSTIYTAYYTVAHLLQGGVVDGSQLGPLGIRVEQLTKEVWDYIFLGGNYPSTDIPFESLRYLRKEFTYWYPFNLRVSAKDLIRNHLTYLLYHHVAIWPSPSRDEIGCGQEYCRWPEGIRVNGNLLLNSEKMGKSTGNFLTLRQSIERFSADGTRLALADAGDGLEHANFIPSMADTGLERLYTLLEWVKEVLLLKDDMRNYSRENWTYHDRIFHNEINKAIILTDVHFEQALFKQGLKTGFFDLQASRAHYCDKSSVEGGMNWNIVLRFIEVQCLLLSPICPHITEHIWDLIGKEGSIMNAHWPPVEN